MEKESEIVEQLKAINKNLEQIAKSLDHMGVELNRMRDRLPKK